MGALLDRIKTQGAGLRTLEVPEWGEDGKPLVKLETSPASHVDVNRSAGETSIPRGPHAVELRELNATGHNTAPWLSPGGLTIHWEGTRPESAADPDPFWIHSARRPNPPPAAVSAGISCLSADPVSVSFSAA